MGLEAYPDNFEGPVFGPGSVNQVIEINGQFHKITDASRDGRSINVRLMHPRETANIEWVKPVAITGVQKNKKRNDTKRW